MESLPQQQQPIPLSMESLYEQQPIHPKPIRIIVTRSYTILVLIISLVLLLTMKGSVKVVEEGKKNKSIELWSLASQRYVVMAIIIGSASNILQLGLVIYFMITGKDMAVNNYKIFFDYYADKVLSLLLAAGVGAQLASTFDITTIKDFKDDVKHFFVVDKISSILLTTAMVSTALSSSCSEKAVQSYRKSIEEGEEKVGIFKSWATRIYNYFCMKFNPQ
ncbi:hypothetical protein V2J09_001160 [Rumex salicifolius]